MLRTGKNDWATIKWSRHQEIIQLWTEINEREREENKESNNHGVGPLKILIDKTGNPLLKDREYQNYWNLKLKLGKINLL